MDVAMKNKGHGGNCVTIDVAAYFVLSTTSYQAAISKEEIHDFPEDLGTFYVD